MRLATLRLSMIRVTAWLCLASFTLFPTFVLTYKEQEKDLSTVPFFYGPGLFLGWLFGVIFTILSCEWQLVMISTWRLLRKSALHQDQTVAIEIFDQTFVVEEVTSLDAPFVIGILLYPTVACFDAFIRAARNEASAQFDAALDVARVSVTLSVMALMGEHFRHFLKHHKHLARPSLNRHRAWAILLVVSATATQCASWNGTPTLFGVFQRMVIVPATLAFPILAGPRLGFPRSENEVVFASTVGTLLYAIALAQLVRTAARGPEFGVLFPSPSFRFAFPRSDGELKEMDQWLSLVSALILFCAPVYMRAYKLISKKKERRSRDSISSLPSKDSSPTIVETLDLDTRRILRGRQKGMRRFPPG
jgi:hypothetical protein